MEVTLNSAARARDTNWTFKMAAILSYFGRHPIAKKRELLPSGINLASMQLLQWYWVVGKSASLFLNWGREGEVGEHFEVLLFDNRLSISPRTNATRRAKYYKVKQVLEVGGGGEGVTGSAILSRNRRRPKSTLRSLLPGKRP